MIKIQNLNKREGKKLIFENLNFQINKGEVVGILRKK